MEDLIDGKELPPSVAGWLDEYNRLKAEIKELDERAIIARGHIEEFLQDETVGTLNGKPVIKWINVEQVRFDQAKAKELLSEEQVAACTKTVTMRQFRPVGQDDI